MSSNLKELIHGKQQQVVRVKLLSIQGSVFVCGVT